MTNSEIKFKVQIIKEIKPIKIIFNSNEGSVSHYFHFFYGALIPLIEYHLTNNHQPFIITTNIGPFDRIISELFADELFVGYTKPLVINQSGVNDEKILQFYDDKSLNKYLYGNIISNKNFVYDMAKIDENTIKLPTYDFFGNQFVKFKDVVNEGYKKLNQIRNEINYFIENKMPDKYKNIKTYDIILLDRKTDPYYMKEMKEQNKKYKNIYFTSGSQRRYILNHEKLAEKLNSLYGADLGLISLENMSIFEQYQIFKNAKIIIGQHGAGLANLFFCNNNPHIIEITSPWAHGYNEDNVKTKGGYHFKNLSEFLNFSYDEVYMENNIDNVDIDKILHHVNIK